MNQKQIITEFLRQIGRKGGQSRSPAKVAAARQNSQKAGRPKGSKNKQKA